MKGKKIYNFINCAASFIDRIISLLASPKISRYGMYSFAHLIVAQISKLLGDHLLGVSFLKWLLAVSTAIVLEQIDNDKGHIIRANTILLTHFVECIRADLVEELVVAVVDILITCPMHRQHLFVMTHDLRRCFAVPNSIAGKDDEFHVFV